MVSVQFLARLWCLFLLNGVQADLECRNFVPKGAKCNVGVLNFAGQGKENYVPSTNASVGEDVYLPPHQNQKAAIWHFQTCNSTSLNFSSSAVTDDCYDSGCQKYYYNDVRIIGPASGQCLTAQLASNGLYTLVPQKCNDNPTNTKQIFQTLQYIYYTPFYKQLIGYGQVNILPYGYAANYGQDNELDPWVIGKDNKTVYFNPPKIGLSENSLHGNIVVTG